jgi:hypothetical protein
VNRSSPEFVPTDDVADDGSGSKWSHRPFWEWLRRETTLNPDAVRSSIDDAFVSIIFAARETFLQQANTRGSFELFGLDVMLDDKGKIFVLEVNVSPAMGTPSKLDRFIKEIVVRDLFNAALVPRSGDAAGRIEAAMRRREDVDVVEFVAVAEFEIAQRRLGGFRCIYPTPERVISHGSALAMHTKADCALEAWVTSRESGREQWIRTRLPKFQAATSSNF